MSFGLRPAKDSDSLTLARSGESGRQNVGSPADSEGNPRRAHMGKCPFAGEKLEAAGGVEPPMEILQSSLRRVHE